MKPITDYTDDELQQLAVTAATVTGKGIVGKAEAEDVLAKMKAMQEDVRDAKRELDGTAQMIEQL